MEKIEGPKILPVQDRDDLPKEKPLHPNLPKPPILMVLNSPIRTGKSTIISNIYLNDNFFGQDYFDKIHVLSPTIHNDDTSRYLLKFADCYDGYKDEIIDDIIAHQNTFKEKKFMPAISICLDDCLGTIRREARINHLASKFRHYNIKLLMISSQKFRHVSPVIRSNATCVIVGSPYPNQMELDKIFEEYGDQFGGYLSIKHIYKLATPNRYDFLMLNLAENPPLAFHNMETLLAIGPKLVGAQGNIKENDDEVDDFKSLKNEDEINNIK